MLDRLEAALGWQMTIFDHPVHFSRACDTLLHIAFN